MPEAVEYLEKREKKQGIRFIAVAKKNKIVDLKKKRKRKTMVEPQDVV